VSVSNFNPRNIQCVPAVKIFAFLELERNGAFFKGFVSTGHCKQGIRNGKDKTGSLHQCKSGVNVLFNNFS
jgi:hypothetical protein